MTNDAAPTRRNVVAAVALGAVAGTGLVACSGDDEAPTGGEGTSGTGENPGGSGGAPGSGADGGSSGDATGGTDAPRGEAGDVTGTLTKVGDVPVGGAVIVEATQGVTLIVARPAEGEVVAFDARCPHQGCTVTPRGERLVCPCHQSAFETATGKVLTGPAKTGLTRVPVTVDGDDIVPG